MRSPRADRARAGALCLAFAACAPAAAQPSEPVAASAPSDDAAARAAAVSLGAARLREDPLLSRTRKAHTLRWTADVDARAPTPPDQRWLAWFVALARFVNDASRLLVYGIGLVLVAVLVVSLRHLVRRRAAARRLTGAAAVSHVRDLDVRPQSLPDDVGAAAWALWQAGRVGEALSLLYRGALSRLIHRHGVPIDAASTEGECLSLAGSRIDAAALRYLTQVVRAWEAHRYGARTLSAAMGEALCAGFAQRLDASCASQADVA